MPIDCASVEETRRAMQEKLAGIVPEVELRYKAELVYEINRLKKERGALILGHNYMEPALFHTVPDVVGDSLELARAAAATHADPVVFCGVRFMAETAKILNPSRTVLLPAPRGGCSLAESITTEDVRRLRSKFPGAPVVAYINTSAAVKAEVDIICTSGNAAKVMNGLRGRPLLFLPDEYLARNVAGESGRPFVLADQVEDASRLSPDTVIGWCGRCEVHERFEVQDVRNARSQFPDVIVLAHPECSPEVTAAADFSGSTSAMITYVRRSPARRFLLLTECSMGDNIIAENRDKEAIRLCSIRCPHMNEITLEDTLRALRENRTVIEVPEEIQLRARRALERMLDFV